MSKVLEALHFRIEIRCSLQSFISLHIDTTQSWFFPVYFLTMTPFKQFNSFLQLLKHFVANWRMEAWILSFPIIKPSNNPLTWSITSKTLSTLLIRRKRKEDKRSPCLIPLVENILPLGLPLINIENLGSWTQPIIQDIHRESKFLHTKIFSRNTQSTWSKVFLQSLAWGSLTSF